MQGIPWKYTWKELKDMFAEVGEVAHADVMFSPDGRSKVRTGQILQKAGSDSGAAWQMQEVLH